MNKKKDSNEYDYGELLLVSSASLKFMPERFYLFY